MPVPGNSTSGAAYQPDDSTTAIVDACRSAIAWRPDDGGAPESYRTPTHDERQLLDQRRRHLSVIARGCGATDAEKRKAAVAVAEMLGGFLRTRNLDDGAKQRMVAGMLADLMALPAWAIVRACDRFRKGEVDGQNLSFAPTSAEVYQAAVQEMSPLRAEQRAIDETLRLLPPRRPSQEQERLAEKARSWLDRTDPKVRKALGLDEKGRDEVALARTREAMAATVVKTRAAWGGQMPPTIGGVPVSRELAEQLRLNADNRPPDHELTGEEQARRNGGVC